MIGMSSKSSSTLRRDPVASAGVGLTSRLRFAGGSLGVVAHGVALDDLPSWLRGVVNDSRRYRAEPKGNRQPAIDHSRPVPAEIEDVTVEQGEVAVELAAGDLARSPACGTTRMKFGAEEARASVPATGEAATARANPHARSARSCLAGQRHPISGGKN